MRIHYAELRKAIAEWPKYPNAKREERSPLLHDGFPGNFNLSYAEYFWLKEYGRYLGWDFDYVFTTIESCIRVADFPKLQSGEY